MPDKLTGRELDGRVAARLFGLMVEPHVNLRTGKPDVVYQLPSGDWVMCAYYSSSGPASLTLALRLRELGWSRTDNLLSTFSWNAATDPRVILKHRDGRIVEATGHTQLEALARAAVKTTS